MLDLADALPATKSIDVLPPIFRDVHFRDRDVLRDHPRMRKASLHLHRQGAISRDRRVVRIAVKLETHPLLDWQAAKSSSKHLAFAKRGRDVRVPV